MNLRIVSARPLCASTPLAALAEDLTPPRLHFVRDHFDRPAREDVAARPLRIEGLVERPREVAPDALRARPSRALVVTMECAGNSRARLHPPVGGVPWDDGAVSTARWEGAPLAALLAEARPRPEARHVVFHGADGFARALPLDEARRDDVLVAWGKDGAPLALAHGGPARLLVPGWYGMASVKWLVAVELCAEPFEGRFQTQDYLLRDAAGRALAPVERVRPKALVHAPAAGARLTAGTPARVEGRAWSGAAPLVRVEVSADGGATWSGAELGPDLGRWAWRAFRWTWTPAAGTHVLAARAVDAAGEAQPLAPPWNAQGYANNAVAPVVVHAE